jgi:sodium/hydrogen antiporter
VKANAALPKHLRLSRAGDGLVFVAITFLAYGTAQMAGAYGFLAVFACAATIRNVSPQVDLHRRLNTVADQIERFSTAAVLVFLGGVLATGGFRRLTWGIVAVAAIALFVARPIGVAVSFLRSPATAAERAAFAFFGIRGLASLYYAAYLLNHGKAYWDTVWPAALVTILASIVVFGMTSGFVMSWLGLERRPSSS